MRGIVRGLSVAGAALLGYSVVAYPAILRLLPERPTHPHNEWPKPKVSLVFSAFNEEAALGHKLRNIEMLRGEGIFEVLAYSDASTDRTAEILRGSAEVDVVVVGKARRGKTAGLRELVSRSAGDVILQTDANTLLDPGAIAAIDEVFKDPTVGGAVGRMFYRNASESGTADVGSSFWNFSEWVAHLESRSGSVVGAGGAAFAIRRDLYPAVPDGLLDDFVVSLAPLFANRRVVVAPGLRAFEDMATSPGTEMERRRRIACRAINTHRYVKPQVRGLSTGLRWRYWSHKVSRWLLPYAGLVIGIGAVAELAKMSEPRRRAITAGLVGLLFSTRTRSALASLAGVVRGHIDALQGRTVTTWAPPRG